MDKPCASMDITPPTLGPSLIYPEDGSEEIVPVPIGENCGEIAQTLMTEFQLGPVQTIDETGITISMLQVKL